MTDGLEGESGAVQGDVTSDERTWGLIAHLSTLSGYVGLPFGWILGPLIVYLIKKDESAYVKAHAMEAMNFGITFTIAIIVATALALVLVGLLVLPVLVIVGIVFPILAGLKANEGRGYRYPWIFRLVS